MTRPFGATGATGRWWNGRSVRGKGFAVLAIPLFALAAAGTAATLAEREQDEARDAVVRTFEIREALNRGLRLLVDSETGVRGYLLTRDVAFLEPYRAARDDVERELRFAMARATDPIALRGMEAVGELARQALFQLDELLRSDGAASGGDQLPRLHASKDTLDRIRDELAGVAARQEVLLADRQAHAEDVRSLQRRFLVASLAIGVGGGAAAMGVFTSGLRRRLRTLVQEADRRAGERGLPPLTEPGDEVDELRATLARLETLVTEKERQLEAARDDAQAANGAKTEFLSRMSHELRTPLNAILGFAQLLRMSDDLSGDDRSAVAHVHRAGEHLLQLIDEVLDIERIESGRMTLSLEPVALAGVLEDACELIQPLASAEDVTVSLAVATCGAAAVYADRQRLRQVVLNLLSNAVKYNRKGGRVDVTCEADGDLVAVSVKDTGVGMAMVDEARLFAPFDRLGAEESAVPGTGIGLALSLRLVELMGGRIDVESDEGAGSCFTFRLRRAATVERVVAEPVADHEDAPSDAPPTVLYVEDNPSNVQLVERILALRPSVTFRAVGDGRHALEAIDAEPPGLVLLDLHLPDMHGVELLRRLKAHPSTRATRVVVVTADATRDVKRRAMAAGAARLLTKPVDVRALLEVVDETARLVRADADAAR